MQFRLTYRGPLKSRTSATAKDKHDIRQHFHSQLKALWDQLPLKEHRHLIGLGDEGRGDGTISLISDVGPFRFASLVSAVYGWNTTAKVELLLLRPSEPGEIVNHGGDLDNRLKVLFDALRVPNESELPKNCSPSEDQRPFFVLLQDDALVTRFSVETDRLLDPNASRGDVELIINVVIGVTRTSMANAGIGG